MPISIARRYTKSRQPFSVANAGDSGDFGHSDHPCDSRGEFTAGVATAPETPRARALTTAPVKLVAAVVIVTALVLMGGCETYVRRTDLAEEYFNLGNAFYELEGYERAVEYYEKALALEPDLAPANFNLARAYIESGDYAEAIPLLESLIENGEESVLVLESLAYAYTKQRRYEEALELYNEVLSVSPFRVSALYSSALVHRRLEQYEEARSLLARARETAPQDTDVMYYYGRVLYDTDNAEKAISVLAEYLDQSGSEGIDRRLEVARIFAEQRYYARAISVYDQVLEVEPDEETALFEKAALQLTVTDEPAAGEENLAAALDSGFQNEQRASELVERDVLLSRARVTELLSEAGLLTDDSVGDDADDGEAPAGEASDEQVPQGEAPEGGLAE